MNVNRHKKTMNFVAMLLVGVMTALLLSVPGDASAARRGRRVIVSPRVAHVGRVIHRLPARHRVIHRLPARHRVVHMRGKRYFYHRGRFYRPARSGFVVVSAPIGAVIVSLPVGFRTVWIAGVGYYVYGGVFYRREPAGYVVVEPPAEVVVADESPPVVEPPEAATGKVSVNVATLNVRAGPSDSYPVIHQAFRGEILDVYGKSEEWLYVQLPDGQFGWVMTEFTIQTEPPASG